MVTTRETFGRLAAVASATFVLLVGVVPAGAQQIDSRWQALYGCWQPVDSASALNSTPAARVVCVVPAQASSAEIVTIDNGKITQRETLLATGERHTVAENGCTGWESAQWSKTEQRVYLHSNFNCSGGMNRVSTGLLTMLSENQWMDVQSVNISGIKNVRVARYKEADDAADIPAEIAAVIPKHSMAQGTVRLFQAAPITIPDVIDASKNVDAAVVEAWLVERGEGFKLDAKQLAELAQAKVPGSVTDLMVALSYPDLFTVSRPTRSASATERPATNNRPTSANYPVGAYDNYGNYYDPFYDDPFGYSRYNRYNNYGQYGYNQYGYGPYGYYRNYTPVIVVVGSGTQVGGNGGASNTPEQPRGRAVNGRGYTQSSGSSSSGSSSPKASTSTTSSGSSTSSSSGSSGSSGSSSSGSSSAGSSGGDRVAHPRTPPPPPPSF